MALSFDLPQVLDVAGGGAGGGGLAFSLLNYNAVPACVVDPRPPVSKKAVALLTFAGPSAASPLHAKYDTHMTPRGDPPRYPRFIRRCVEDGALGLCGPARPPLAKPAAATAVAAAKQPTSVQAADAHTASEADVRVVEEGKLGYEVEEGDTNYKNYDNAVEAAAVGGGREEEEAAAALTSEWRAGPTPAQTPAEAALEVVGDAAVALAVQTCSVVCGLHADGATVPLVRWALAHGKPFAVVPCCVFWKSVVGLEAAGVKTHEDLLGYLQALRPPGEIVREDLAFDGRNTVLWWRGPPSPTSAEELPSLGA